MNVQIPAPGSRGVVILRNVNNGVQIVQVHVYSPSDQKRLTLDGTYFPDVYQNELAAKQDVSKALADNPVVTIVLDDIT